MKKSNSDNQNKEKDVRTIRGGADVATENRTILEQHHCTALKNVFQIKEAVHERFS